MVRWGVNEIYSAAVSERRDYDGQGRLARMRQRCAVDAASGLLAAAQTGTLIKAGGDDAKSTLPKQRRRAGQRRWARARILGTRATPSPHQRMDRAESLLLPANWWPAFPGRRRR